MKSNTNVKKPIIYLHIGMNKTGSTSIQDYFFNNKDDFNIEGFCYPSAGLNSKGIHYGLSDAFGFYNNKIKVPSKKVWVYQHLNFPIFIIN